MAEKIFLEKNRNIEAVNKENKINVNLTQKARLLPFNNLSVTLNLSDLFLKERDACDKYRFIFSVNPICSNVLYNMKTEIVMDEGSSSCRALVGEEGFSSGYTTIAKSNISAKVSSSVNPVDRLQAIRNTEYSHPNVGGLVYHCGLDIFNNHMLRSREFVHINRLAPNGASYETCSQVFNTIFDYQRDVDGKVITEQITDSPSTDSSQTKMHVYRVDSVMSFEEAYAQHFKEKDGWFGFNNVGFIEIPNDMRATLSLNKVMNNNKACEFIDMYPDRSLYSFIPKRNKYRQRSEKNWDYCITYPYESDKAMFNKVMKFNWSGEVAIKAHVYTGKTANGYDLYLFRTVIKHNLSHGDTIRLFNHMGNKLEITISGIGDVDGSDKEHCFRIYANQLDGKIQLDPGNYCVWIRKLSNSSGCEYYFRKFKKILNPDGSELNSTIGKLAFGENIYGDRVSEVIYTDDVNVEGLRDNLGRPLSELFFTVIKTNRGHDLWYKENKFSDVRVEYSHCFGKVTSGVELVGEDENDYNVRKIHNVNYKDVPSGVVSVTKGNFKNRAYRTGMNAMFGSITPYETLENDITEDKFNVFYGDIVEFDPSTNRETVLEKVYHRFNTAQRELCNMPCYYDLRYDMMVADDYDSGVELKSGSTRMSYAGFTVLSDELGREPETTAQINLSQRSVQNTYLNVTNKNYFFPGNIQPEGYFYQPHHRIKIREISDRANTQVGAVINYVANNAYTTRSDDDRPTHFIELTTTDDFSYIVGDLFGVYNKKTEKLCWGVIDGCTYYIDQETQEPKIDIKMEVSTGIDLATLKSGDLEIVLTDGSVPTYASYMTKEQKFVWRDVLAPSEVSIDNPLSDMMFTNGVNYIHDNINFYVKRQDPFGKNGLLVPMRDEHGKDISPLRKYKKFGFEINKSMLLYLAIETQNACL